MLARSLLVAVLIVLSKTQDATSPAIKFYSPIPGSVVDTHEATIKVSVQGLGGSQAVVKVNGDEWHR
jgi:hypothetical protein